MRPLLTTLVLLTAGHAAAAEIKLSDSSRLVTSTDAPDPAKTYWLAVAVANTDGKGVEGAAAWATGDVLVLNPAFVDPLRDPKAPKTADTYEMAGPTHVARLKALIGEVGKTWKLRPKIFLYGYSAGAGFAHRFAMQEPGWVAGVAAASADSWSDHGFGEINPAARNIPFAISCGEHDRGKVSNDLPFGRIEWAKQFGAGLKEANFDVVTRVIENNGHQPHAEALELAKSCFARARALNLSRTAPLAFDFNDADPLWNLSADATPASSGVTAIAKWDERAGMVEERGTSLRTGGLSLSVNSGGPSAAAWSGGMGTGLLPVNCPEPDLKKLALAFDLSASTARPVRVTIESFGADRQRSGGLTGTIHPAAADFYHRHVLDLGTMTADGQGTFRPQDPLLRVTFRIGADGGWPAAAGNQIRVDNLGYAAPAFYVSPAGNDASNDGHSADRPLATVQKAVDRARAGDVILVMDGTYTSDRNVADIRGTGVPAAWLVLRSHPGHCPVFRSSWWDCVKIGQGNDVTRSTAPATAYVEIRGLTIEGYAKEVEAKYKDKIGLPQPETNGNGISADGRFQDETPHHIRVADCTVFDCPGGGINAMASDRVAIENNHVHGNCHWMIYAGSGISTFHGSNFEATPLEYRLLVRNNCCHDNYCTQPWAATGKLSDGNGIIVDDMRNTQIPSPTGIYHGRVLVQGNVSYLNGGSGMHAFSSNHVDFINNTTYGNNRVMDYAQISITECFDCRMLNNIIVAPPDKAINRVNGNSKGILIAHNLDWGGNTPPAAGDRPLTADPLFVDAGKGDFRLKPGSPALKAGGWWENLPATYQDGSPRGLDGAPDLGALPVAR